jgi:glycosyltransferase involved in cell wall biosynthesis
VNEQDHPKVSCLLPVYNGEQFIEEAVRSLLAQTLKNFELVVVDDGSTDSTPRKLAALNAEDQRLRILRQANGGIVAALNAGLGLCRAGYIARMDADDVAAPDRFE